MSIADVFQPPREVPSALKLSCGMPLFSFCQSICSFLFLIKGQVTVKLRGRGVFLNRRSMDNLFLKRVNSWQGIVKKEQESIFVKSMSSLCNL